MCKIYPSFHLQQHYVKDKKAKGESMGRGGKDVHVTAPVVLSWVAVHNSKLELYIVHIHVQ